MKYTNEQLIQELKDFAAYLGRTPVGREVTEDTFMPSRDLYKNRFGTWNKALELAGLKPVKPQKQSKDSLIERLQLKAKELGRTPSMREVNSTTLIRHFGSYKKACIVAGLEPNRPTNNGHITEESLALSCNKEWLQEQNKTKTLVEISKDLGFTKTYMSTKFSKLGIDPVKHNDSIKEKEWLDSLGITERQYPIENYRVDGYNPETNTVYEFLGDYWHGNPEVYDPNEYNEVVKKTFGQLFDETMKRLDYIKSLGYNIIVQWENNS